MTGRFITIEGGEGAGKSSAIAAIEQFITEATGDEVVVTREPGGTALGEAIRNLVLGFDHKDMAPEAELLLMAAARAEHLAKVIRPALSAGKWVICDRFNASTWVYQGLRGVSGRMIQDLDHLVVSDTDPDLTILLDVPVQIGLARVSGRGGETTRFDEADVAFHEQVRQRFLTLAADYDWQFRVIDAGQDQDAVTGDLQAALGDYLDQVARQAQSRSKWAQAADRAVHERKL